MRCDTCWRDIERDFPDIVYNEWLKLMHYFEHEYSEEEITEQTYNSMTNALMALKPKESTHLEEE